MLSNISALVKHFLAVENQETFDPNHCNATFQLNCPRAAMAFDEFTSSQGGVHVGEEPYGYFRTSMSAAGRRWRQRNEPEAQEDAAVAPLNA